MFERKESNGELINRTDNHMGMWTYGELKAWLLVTQASPLTKKKKENKQKKGCVCPVASGPCLLTPSLPHPLLPRGQIFNIYQVINLRSFLICYLIKLIFTFDILIPTTPDSSLSTQTCV